MRWRSRAASLRLSELLDLLLLLLLRGWIVALLRRCGLIELLLLWLRCLLDTPLLLFDSRLLRLALALLPLMVLRGSGATTLRGRVLPTPLAPFLRIVRRLGRTRRCDQAESDHQHAASAHQPPVPWLCGHDEFPLCGKIRKQSRRKGGGLAQSPFCQAICPIHCIRHAAHVSRVSQGE